MLNQRQFAAGSVIFREGEESDQAYIIRSGRVEIYKQIDQGTLLLATLGEGEIFGEMGVICERPRQANAAAQTDVSVSELNREMLAAALKDGPEEVALIVRTLMERLSEANLRVAKLMNKHAQFQLGGAERKVPAVTRVKLKPLTSLLKTSLPEAGMVLTSLPYRVGGLPQGAEANPLDWNNLFIPNADTTVISRNHFAIQKNDKGVMISDRGSRTGTIVNDVKIGAGAENFEAQLKFGENIVIAGGEGSPYRFSVTWE